MRQIFVNLAVAEIATASVGTGDTTFDVVDASKLPVPGADEYWVGVIYKRNAAGEEYDHEVAHVTGLSTATLTLSRGEEGTTAKAFSAGDFIELRNTAATLDRIRTTETVASATTSIDRADGGIQTLTLTANSTLSVAISEGQSLTLHLNGGDTYSVTWPTMTWVGGSAPTLTSADVIEFWKVGTTLYGAYVGSVA